MSTKYPVFDASDMPTGVPFSEKDVQKRTMESIQSYLDDIDKRLSRLETVALPPATVRRLRWVRLR